MPELLTDPRNLITLCSDDHLYIGHLGNWSIDNFQLAEMLKKRGRK